MDTIGWIFWAGFSLSLASLTWLWVSFDRRRGSSPQGVVLPQGLSARGLSLFIGLSVLGTWTASLVMDLSFWQNSTLSFSQPYSSRPGVPPLTEGVEADGFALDARPALAGQMVGVASWYGLKFEGRQTASGEVFLSRRLTLASRVIPLGSIVEITNLGNGKRVKARVNDRGPYIKGRGFDVSRAVARRLGFQKAGLAKVKVRVLRSKKVSPQISLTWPLHDQTPGAGGTPL